MESKNHTMTLGISKNKIMVPAHNIRIQQPQWKDGAVLHLFP